MGQAIIFCSRGYYLLSFFFFLFPRLFSVVGDWMSTILPVFNTWCGRSANLECRSEMYCTWLAENTQRKNYAKKLPSVHHRTTLLGYIFATKAHIDNRKKLVKQQYLLQISSQYGELRPTNGCYQLASLGTPANFNECRVLASLLHRHRSTEVSETLNDVWLSPRMVCYIHFWGLLPRMEFCQV